MASRNLPGLGLNGFWNLGEDGWNTGMDENLRVLSAVAQGAALSRTTALPGSPTDGDIYIVPTGSGGDSNKLALRDDGAWVYLTPQQGWVIYIIDAAEFRYWTGASWVLLSAGGGASAAEDVSYDGGSGGPDNVQDALDALFASPGGGISDAPSDDGYYVRRNGAWTAIDPTFTLNVITSSDATYNPLVSNGAKQFVRLTHAAPTFAVPADSTEGFPIGTVIEVQQMDSGAVVFDPEGGVTVQSRDGADQTAGQFAIAALVKVASNTWTLTGDVE